MPIQEITKDNFNSEVLQSDRPVLVEFWAPWCVHCKRLAPVLERLAEKYGETIVFGGVHMDEQPELAAQHEISLVPTLYLYKNGVRSEKLVAPGSQAAVEEWLNAQ